MNYVSETTIYFYDDHVFTDLPEIENDPLSSHVYDGVERIRFVIHLRKPFPERYYRHAMGEDFRSVSLKDISKKEKDGCYRDVHVWYYEELSSMYDAYENGRGKVILDGRVVDVYMHGRYLADVECTQLYDDVLSIYDQNQDLLNCIYNL